MYINKIRGISIADIPSTREALEKYIGRRAVVIGEPSNTESLYRHGLKMGTMFILSGIKTWADEGNYLYEWRSPGGKKKGLISHAHIAVEPITQVEYEKLLEDIKSEVEMIEERISYLKELTLPNYDPKSYLVWKLTKIQEKGGNLFDLFLRMMEKTDSFTDLAF